MQKTIQIDARKLFASAPLTPAGWDKECHKLWLAEKKTEAIAMLRTKIPGEERRGEERKHHTVGL